MQREVRQTSIDIAILAQAGKAPGAQVGLRYCGVEAYTDREGLQAFGARR
jgi:hypothetical protein